MIDVVRLPPNGHARSDAISENRLLLDYLREFGWSNRNENRLRWRQVRRLHRACRRSAAFIVSDLAAAVEGANVSTRLNRWSAMAACRRRGVAFTKS